MKASMGFNPRSAYCNFRQQRNSWLPDWGLFICDMLSQRIYLSIVSVKANLGFLSVTHWLMGKD